MKKTPDSYTSLLGDMFHHPRTDAVYSIPNAVVKTKEGKARWNKEKRICTPNAISFDYVGRICVSP